MKIALIVSLLVTSLALNAEMLQGKVVRVANGGAITILVERMLGADANPIPHWEFRESKKEKSK